MAPAMQKVREWHVQEPLSAQAKIVIGHYEVSQVGKGGYPRSSLPNFKIRIFTQLAHRF